MERLSTSYVFARTLDGVTANRSKLVDMYEQIASGKNIRKASDDPVLSARILDMQRNISNIEQSERYATTALNDLTTEEAVLTQVQSLVLRARTLVLQGVNGTQGAENKKIIGGELNQVLDQIAELSNSKNADGAYIFAGYMADNPAYQFTRNGSGEIVTSSYLGDGNSVEKTVSPTLRVSVTHPGSAIFTSAGANIFDQLVSARDDLYAGIAPTNLTTIDAGYDRVTKAITEIGARTNQVESAAEVNGLIRNSMEKSLGKIRDLDLPTAITHFTQLETTVSAINSTFAKISKISLFDYL